MSLRVKIHCPYSSHQTTRYFERSSNQQNTKTIPHHVQDADTFIFDESETPVSHEVQNWHDQEDELQFLRNYAARNEQSAIQRWNHLLNVDPRYHSACRTINTEFNIHTLLANRLVTVPYCYATSQKYNLSLPAEFRDTVNNEWQGGRVKLFFGHLPLVLLTTNLVTLLVKALTGVTPLRVYLTNPSNSVKRNEFGRVTSSPVVVEVRDCDADPVIANINRRVLIDQTSFYVAVTDEQVRILQRYTKLLETNHPIRFNGRPYSTVLVNREQLPGEPRQKNVFNPLCGCHRCQPYKMKHTNYAFLMNEYLPDVLDEFGDDAGFQGSRLLLTHAYLSRDLLTPDQNRHYSDVYRNTLERTRAMTAAAFDSLEQQGRSNETAEDVMCAAVYQEYLSSF